MSFTASSTAASRTRPMASSLRLSPNLRSRTEAGTWPIRKPSTLTLLAYSFIILSYALRTSAAPTVTLSFTAECSRCSIFFSEITLGSSRGRESAPHCPAGLGAPGGSEGLAAPSRACARDTRKIKKAIRSVLSESPRLRSGKRESDPRHRPWQGRALPLSYSRTFQRPTPCSNSGRVRRGKGLREKGLEPSRPKGTRS